MTSLAPNHRALKLRRWIAFSGALLTGLALVFLLVWAGQSNAAPPESVAPPPLVGPDPTLLGPTAQISPGPCPQDVVVVFDISGSMEYSTICYDCWVRTDPTNPDYPNNGYFNPIPADVPSSDLCAATQSPYVQDGYRYLITEAELAAFNPNLWETRYRQTGQGYWAIQRGSRNGDHGNRAGDPSQQSSNVCLAGTGVDCTAPGNPADDLCNDDPGGGDVFVDCSGYMSHHPYATYGQWAPPAELLGMFYYLEDVIDQDPPPPRLEYDFRPDWTGNAYIWLRAQGGGARAYEPIYQDPFVLNQDTIHWAVFFPDTGVQTTPASNTDALGNGRWRDNRADPGEWRWIRLNDTPISVAEGETMVLRLWAGSPGYDIDKIVVTNDARSDWSNIPALTYDDPAPNIGRPATQGSATRAACDPCNPIYGLSVTPNQCTGYSPVLTPTNHLANPLFGELEPLRTSKEAVKRFVQRLEPEFDQAGFVPFTADVDRYDQGQLECIRRYGQACYNPVVQNPPISYTQILVSAEEPTALQATDIAEGMRNGLEVLGVNVRSLPECGTGQNPYDDNCFDNTCDPTDERTGCGRADAAGRMMIVLTDGPPNTNPGGCGDDPIYNFPPENDDDYDCVIYYAGRALQNNVVVHTIGLGNGARADLLEMAAETTGGQFYYTPTPDDLDQVFDEILALIQESCVPGSVGIEPPRRATGLPGQRLTYTHTVTTTGGGFAPKVFTVTTESSLWTPTWSPPTVTVALGQSALVTVSLEIPSGTISGTVDLLSVTVTSQISTTIYDTVTDTTTVGHLQSASFAPDRSGSGILGEEVVYTHTLINLGNFTDTFVLSYTSSLHWPVAVTPSQLTLDVGESALVTAGVTITEGGTTDTTTIRAYAVADASGYDPEPYCAQVIQNGGFEDITLAPWTTSFPGVNKTPDQYEGIFGAAMHTFNGAEHLQPYLAQNFDMPDWIASSSTTMNLSLYQCVRDGLAGSGPEPGDRLYVELRRPDTLVSISSPVLVADGDTSLHGIPCEGYYTHYTTDLATAIRDAGDDPRDYVGQPLELYLYDSSNNLAVCNELGGGPDHPICYETDYYLDNIALNICTSTSLVGVVTDTTSVVTGPRISAYLPVILKELKR